MLDDEGVLDVMTLHSVLSDLSLAETFMCTFEVCKEKSKSDVMLLVTHLAIEQLCFYVMMP